MKILVVEDCKEFQEYIKDILNTNGYKCKILDTARNIVEIATKLMPDLILLDIILPDINGFIACSQLKANRKTESIPIIFLSSKSDVSDKALGLKIGADDYIVKPFEPLELLARIDKRANISKIKNIYHLGPFLLDYDNFCLIINEEKSSKVVELSSLEFKLLAFLMKNDQKILSRNDIIKSVWGSSVYVTDRTVDVRISFLRKKCIELRDSIQSVYGSGYCFGITNV